MNSRQLEYFLAVAKELNFTRAAEKMYVSQTAVTQQIHALEEQLGVTLFDRTKRKVSLTPAGKVFYGEALALLKRMELAKERTREVSSGFTGNLVIGFTVGMGNTKAADRIQDFNSKYPNISLRFLAESPAHLLEKLKTGEVDVGFLPLLQENGYDGICCKKICWSGFIAVLPAHHHLANEKTLTWSQLADEELILAATPHTDTGRDTNVESGFRNHGIIPRVVDRIEDVETIFLMVSVHMGITVLPAYFHIPMDARGRLVAVPFGEAQDGVDLIAGWKEDSKNPSLEKILPILQGEETNRSA